MYKKLLLMAAVLVCGAVNAQTSNNPLQNQSPSNSPTGTIARLSADQMQDFKKKTVHFASLQTSSQPLGQNPNGIAIDKINYANIQPASGVMPMPEMYDVGPDLVKGQSIAQSSNVTSNVTTSLARNLPLTANGKLKSVDGYEVDFIAPKDTNITNVCGTKRPVIQNAPKDAACSYVVPCDNPANRDAINTTTIDYFQLEWHVMWDGGAASNIDQTRIDALMAELNADYASANMIFCADPANFYEDAANYDHDENTEEFSLKGTYNVNPTQVINIYVVGTMGPGGYARFPYDPNGGTSPNGGIVLNRGNCSVGTHTLAHEMGHTMGLEHTFAGVDERADCSNCYEKVRNVNGSSNTTGVATPLGGPYADEGDREGDWCSDTNPHDTHTYQCNTSSNPNNACDSNPWANAPVNNHMSYSFCSTQFTAQQQRRMHCMADSYLGSWIAYGGGICGAQPPTADFVGTPLVWQAPSNVQFTDLSQPTQIITGWTWTFDVGAGGNGVTCTGCVGPNATFTGQNPPTDITYPNPGLYTVSLTITSANGNDTETKVDYVLVNAPAGDCDTLTTQWENIGPTVITYGFGGGWISGVQDPVNSVLPTDPKGVYERYFTPNPGVTPVGAVRVGLGSLRDDNDNMTFQVSVYDDDGAGAPGAFLGGVGGISPTQAGVPGAGFYTEFWVPFLNAPIPTTGSFHVAVEMFPGDATDTLVVMTSCLGPPGCPVAEGEADASNHIWTTGFGYENFLTVYGADFDVDIIPMLGEWAPLPIIEGFTENVVCDTTYVTLFDTAFYSIPSGWSFTFADGTVISSATDPETINRVYTQPGPDTLTVYAVNDCGREDSTTWIIPYNFLETPDAEFTKIQANPICAGAPGVDFTANTAGYADYTWDFGDGTVTSSGNANTINHVYATPGLYYVELTVTEDGFQPLDTFYLEDFESGWPAGYDRYDNDPWTPDPAVNPPFTGTNATAWLDLDVTGNGNTDAVSTSWNGGGGELADDWMLTTAIGPLPANQRLYWDAEASDVNFPDGYEVRISTTQLPANTTNYATTLFSVGAENSFRTTRSVDLSAYAGQTVYIAFRNNSDFMNLLMIDNIRVGTASPGCFATQNKPDFVEIVDCTVIPPTAVLNASPAAGCAPLSVTFTDATVAGDPATSWLWNFGDGTFSTLQNPPAHIYTATGTYFVSFEACNSGGCTTDFITITVGTPPTIDNITPTDPTCAGPNGQIVVTASGGTPPLQYSNDNGVTFQASNTFTGLSATSYDIVVEDANGCQATTTVTLNAPPLPSITNVAVTDPSCNGGSNGQIVITASGGTGAITYSIDNGVTFQASNTFTGLSAATYNIVVEDAGGCQASTTATLTDPPAVAITNVATNDPTCNGGSDGDITITASGGTGALQYSIDNGVTFQAGNNFTGLSAATYNIVVEDANGCQATTTATLNDPTAVAITNVAVTDPTCNGGSDGDITITASGGTAPLQYSIDNGVTFQAGNNFTGLSAATYNIVVEDANGCQASTTGTLTDPPAVTYSVVSTDENCGAGDGTMTLTGGGGDGGPYSYSIDNGVTFQGSGAFTGLAAGPYNIVIEDGSGCQTTAVEAVSSNGGATITGITEDISLVCNGDCNGQLTVSISGGIAPFTYSWTDGSATVVSTSATATGLCADTYTITVTDLGGAGCPVVQAYVLNEPAAVSFTATATDENCGQGNGQINFSGAAGGDGGPYSYSIDNGVTFQGGTSFTGLSAATYNVVVEDGSGCQTASTATVGNIAGPSITNVSTTDPLCGAGDGIITITASGGVAPLQYSIDNGVTFQPGNNFTGLAPATYNIVVEDAAGCQATTTATLTDPGPPTITNIATTNPTCGNPNGDITITATGGTAPLQYSIDNGVTFQAGNGFTGLGPATYDVVVEDALGCQATQTVVLTDPGSPVINVVNTTDPTCGNSDGTIDITASGGTAPLQYSVDNGVTFQAGNNFTGLAAATYDIVVQDANGCQATTQATLSNAGAPTINTINAVDATCGLNNGSIDISATGGTPPLQYSIDNGTTFQASNLFTGLGGGVYDIIVEDAIGCQAIQQITLTASPAPILDSVVTTDPSCGNSNGVIDIYVSAGTAPFQYSIDNGTTFQAAQLFIGLPAASYDVVVEDANGCQVTATVTLNNTAGPTLDGTTLTDPTCGASDGSIVIAASGGTAPLQYSIDNGTTFQASNTFNGLSAGSFDIVIEDANGCQVTATVSLNNTGGLTIDSTVVTEPLCFGYLGQIDFYVSGGTTPFSYSIDGGVTFTTNNSFPAPAGTYNVVIEDVNGCQTTSTVTVTEPTEVTMTLSAPTAICVGESTTLTVTGSGGTPGYTYTWLCDQNGNCALDDNSIASPTASPTVTTMYYAQVTDANGCASLLDSVLITVNQLPAVNAGSDVTIASGDQAPLAATPSGAATYDWTPNDGSLDNPSIENPIATPTVTTTYTVTVTDGNGCVGSDDVTVTVEDLEISIPTGFTPDNDGTNDFWAIDNITNYPEIRVEVYNRWGNLIFESDGYADPWDGTFNGSPVPTGSYYYIIDTKNDELEPYTGTITIIR